MKKYLKIGLVVATCALILFVFVLVRLLFLPTVSNTKKIEDYGQFRLYSNYEMRSDLLAFPNEISKENMEEYIYSYHEYLFDAKCQIYLKCFYDEEEYIKEVDRLSNLEVETSWGMVNKSQLDTENYKYPAYVLSNGLDKTYEYVLMNDLNREIYYILLHDIPKRKVKFEEELLPLDYQQESSKKKFNIHMFDVNGEYKIETKSNIELKKVK